MSALRTAPSLNGPALGYSVRKDDARDLGTGLQPAGE